MSRQRNKRSHHHQEQEDFVDDLAVAASYAVATVRPAITPTNDEEVKDDDEIDLEETVSENDSDENKGESKKMSGVEPAEAKTDGDESSTPGDESDVDLEEELQLMTRTEAEEEDRVSNVISRPKTANEIDPYKVNLDKLRSEFELDITVEEREKLLLERQQEQNVCAAGRIQHFMASERTMVIQSQGNVLLEEGTLLVLRMPTSEAGQNKIVPLGRILEVFGPVCQPLYSLRIPEQLQSLQEKSLSNETKETLVEERKHDEQSEKCPISQVDLSQDPWGENGEYTRLIEENKSNWTVYYPQEGVKILDPTAIFRVSGRGSDASNVYDEEITNPNDVDYSDDEEERAAKRKDKNNRRGGNDRRNNMRGRGPSHSERRPPQGFHPTLHSHSAIPSRALHGAPPNLYAQQSTQMNTNAHHAAGGGSGFASLAVAHRTMGSVPPPPPPPPPVEEESDTVYYDLS